MPTVRAADSHPFGGDRNRLGRAKMVFPSHGRSPALSKLTVRNLAEHLELTLEDVMRRLGLPADTDVDASVQGEMLAEYHARLST